MGNFHNSLNQLVGPPPSHIVYRLNHFAPWSWQFLSQLLLTVSESVADTVGGYLSRAHFLQPASLTGTQTLVVAINVDSEPDERPQQTLW